MTAPAATAAGLADSLERRSLRVKGKREAIDVTVLTWP